MKTKTNNTEKWLNVGSRINLSGVQYSDYQLIVGGLKPGTVLSLIGEPSNKFDPDAIRVEYKGISLGYIPKNSEQQKELWECHNAGAKCIAIVTAFNKSNPTWNMITVQCKIKPTTNNSAKKSKDIKF